MLFPYEFRLVEWKIHSQKFLSGTPSPDTDLFSHPGNLPGHCDFISSSAKLAEHLPTSQMLEGLINVNVCVKMKCCLPNKCQVIQIFTPALGRHQRVEKKKKLNLTKIVGIIARILEALFAVY